LLPAPDFAHKNNTHHQNNKVRPEHGRGTRFKRGKQPGKLFDRRLRIMSEENGR